MPDAETVRRHFEAVLSTSGDVLVLVAEADGEIAGMVEVVPVPDPPDHQIAIPRPSAESIPSCWRDTGTGAWDGRYWRRPSAPPRSAVSW